MPRTKRHATSSHSSNPMEGPIHTMGPSTCPLAPPTNAEEQCEEAPVHQTQADTAATEVVRGRKRSSRTWDVQIRDGNGEVKRQKLRAIDIFSLPPGEKVIVEWNSWVQPIDLSGGMLAQFLGHIASNCQILPIGYEKWQKIPECYKDHVWNNIIKTKLDVNDDGHKKYIFKSLGKKWRDHWYNLYNHMKCDPDSPREANIAKRPPEIPLEQWVAFVDYRSRPETKTKAEQNTVNRTHLTMPHTLGSKSFARLQNEMESQLGRPVTRAELFQASHTTSEGSFINEEARHNHEQLIVRSQSSSENEAFTSVFGKEHPGYVRGMGLRVVPTQVYGSSSDSGGKRECSGDSQAEVDVLRGEVQRLTQVVQSVEERFLSQQRQIEFLTQQLASQGRNTTHNQENIQSPSITRESSNGSHSGHG